MVSEQGPVGYDEPQNFVIVPNHEYEKSYPRPKVNLNRQGRILFSEPRPEGTSLSPSKKRRNSV